MNADITTLIEKLPDGGIKAPDDAAPARQALTELAARGPVVVSELAALLKGEEGGDTKVRLALHNLATWAAQQEDAVRQSFATALAEAASVERPADANAFLIRQVQLCGGQEVVPALGKLLEHEALAEPAATALVAIREGAAEPLRKALPSARGRMRLVLVQSVGVLRDVDSAESVRRLVDHDDVTLRLAAAESLAAIGGAGDANALLALARREEGYAQAKAVDACFHLAERLGEKGQATERTALLRDLATLGRGTYVAEAATRALESAAP